MQMIDIATLKAAKATDRRALAILAYDNATTNPDGANWRAVADMLRIAMPAAKARPAAVTDSRFAPWADYAIPKSATGHKLGKSPVIVVTFADGEIVRAPAVSMPGKLLNIGRALRVAIAFYQCRIASRMGANSDSAHVVSVPAMVAVVCETTGAEFDAVDCSVRAAEWSAGSFDYTAARIAAASYPESTDDGATDRASYLAAAFRLAVARQRLAALPDGADENIVRHLNRDITVSELRMEGLSNLQIIDRERQAEKEAVKAATAPADTPRSPATPTFRVPSRFLESSRLNVIPFRPAAAPSRRGSSIMRVA